MDLNDLIERLNLQKYRITEVDKALKKIGIDSKFYTAYSSMERCLYKVEDYFSKYIPNSFKESWLCNLVIIYILDCYNLILPYLDFKKSILPLYK